MCTTDIVDLYSNISYSEGITSLRRLLELSNHKKKSSDALIELAEIVLKNSFKQVRGTAFGTKFSPVFAILFIAHLEEKNSKRFLKDKSFICSKYIDEVFYLGTWRKISGKISE